MNRQEWLDFVDLAAKAADILNRYDDTDLNPAQLAEMAAAAKKQLLEPGCPHCGKAWAAHAADGSCIVEAEDELVPEGWACPCGERRMDNLLPGEDGVIHCFTCDSDYAFQTVSEDGDASEVICQDCGRKRQAKGDGPAVYRLCVQCQLEADKRTSDQDGTSGQDRESYTPG